ncbi:sugar transferase [Parasulfitobacter algicola]|uniref:Sugar transferase n=1 Tax=Parasulfitobacter algicola TaxID=2614809 RepID=A0ABX2IRD4_9RHOB|nr:sugar transferase [Sulfitobacter algicola]NSX54905.1 sugar transferase [Sulfitobacter algicola]
MSHLKQIEPAMGPSASYGRPQIAVKRADSTPTGGVWKRMLDIAVSLVAIVLLSPLLIGVAVIVKLTSKGAVFYGHGRIGHNGTTFKCWKFRTMVSDSDAALRRYLEQNPDARAEWDQDRKLKNDPRITKIGKTLRDLSIDELPQLFNILKGEMSIVGPRPVVMDELEKYGRSAVFYLKSRPGLTGLWQISGRNDVSYERRVLLDRFYVVNWSFFKDLRIILKTVPAVLGSRGSY